MKNLPLFYYPHTWLWIDDDRTLLNAMTLAFSEDHQVLPFQSANKCLEFLEKQYQPPSSQFSFLKSNIEDENYGTLQRTPVDFDVTTIAKLADNPERKDEISAMVIDYNMPEMNGFTLAEQTSHSPIQKILLTGNAQDNDAITAFNNNLIQRFVQKADAQMYGKLSDYLTELSRDYFRKLTDPLLTHLEAEVKLPLSDPIFIKFFENYCKNNNIIEYYLIDKNGSFLCINNKGERSCLAVQSNRSIDTWLALHGEEKTLSQDIITALTERKKIPFFGVGKEAWQLDPAEWSEHFYLPEILAGRETYYWVTVK